MSEDWLEEEDDWLNDEHWYCRDCDIHTGVIGEYYMVTNDLWAEYGVPEGMLCLFCFEERVGRDLRPDDFPDLPINNPWQTPKSDFALLRIKGTRTPGARDTDLSEHYPLL